MLPMLAKSQINPIEKILINHPEFFKEILSDPNQKEIQIIYTQINRDQNNIAHFKTYSYNVDKHHYFYPASTIKLPTAIFTLEKLNELNITGLDKKTSLKIGKEYGKQTAITEDLSNENGLPSLANYIKKILLVSDNDAYNRLYEFVGRQEINKKLKHYGFKNSRIISRLSVGDNGENARYTNPFTFYNNNQIIYQQALQYDDKDYHLKLKGLLKGEGYMDSKDSLIKKPFNFADKNVFQLKDQHLLMQKLMFPESFPISKQFKLSESDYQFLYTYMSKYPTEITNPSFQNSAYYPTYCKFLFYGADKNITPNSNIRIFNKVGDAYGYTIDNIYFIDYKNKVEFILSAVIQSNNNQIYNDNTYEYETICLPFLKNLGQKVYELELKRTKKYEPQLDKFIPYQKKLKSWYSYGISITKEYVQI
jgi:hypothetical protein